MTDYDDFTLGHLELLDGVYDCVDRIVLNAYFQFAQSGGGFRCWWRKLFVVDDQLDNTHLMRFAGRFARRVRAYCEKEAIPLVICKKGERKHEIAAQHSPDCSAFVGVFCILVGRSQAPVRDVERYGNGGINIKRKTPMPYVNQYFFHIMDPGWGHIIIKLCPHPPFNAQIILNGHEYVARQAKKKRIRFTKEGNCFTDVSNLAGLGLVADTMSAKDAEGCLARVCERWIYSACLCFALTSDEQRRSGFRYNYSVYQAEYSRNLLFKRGRQMEIVFDGVIDRSRAPLNVKTIKTIFGYKHRPSYKKKKRLRFESVVEKPVWNLTVFKVHFGRLTVKIYSKGERVLRIEAVAHNTKDLRCRRSVDNFPTIVSELRLMVERFLAVLRYVNCSFIDSGVWENLPLPSTMGSTRVTGVDVNKPRMRAVMASCVALSLKPKPFFISELATKVPQILDCDPKDYTPRQASYDLKKLRGKGLVRKLEYSRQYEATPEGLRFMVALEVLREKVIMPLLSGACSEKQARKTIPSPSIDDHYDAIMDHMRGIFENVGIAA